MTILVQDIGHTQIALKSTVVGGEHIIGFQSLNADGSSPASIDKVAFGGANGATAAIPSANADTLLQAANAARTGLFIANDSTAILYVLLGTGAASATNYTFAIPAKVTVATDRLVSGYTGMVRGFWAAANGFAYVTEIS